MRYTVLLLCLTGCATATTPGDVMRKGARSDYKSSRAPAQVAACIERNAAEIKWGLLHMAKDARSRPGAAPGTFEVLYSEEGIALAVAEVRPNGAAYTIWRSPDLLATQPRGEGSLEEQMSRGC